MKPAVTLNPHTPVSVLEDILSDSIGAHMSVNPGFGGQQFIEQTLGKVAAEENDRGARPKTLIQVDGGVNLETGRKLVDAGADVLVAGSYIFSSDDPEEAIRGLKAL